MTSESAVLRAAKQAGHKGRGITRRAFQEHGQWWLVVEDDHNDDEPSRTYSVVDCEDRYGQAYLGFEQV